MKSRVRIVKRDRAECLQSAPLIQDEKTARQSEREIAGTVKMWIAELAQRRRADEYRGAMLLNGANSAHRVAQTRIDFTNERVRRSVVHEPAAALFSPLACSTR